MRIIFGRLMTYHLGRCYTSPYVCLTFVKTYVKIKISKPPAFHE
jgi:hypothetical protein